MLKLGITLVLISGIVLLAPGCKKSAEALLIDGAKFSPASNWYRLEDKDLNEFKAGYASRVNDPNSELLAVWSAERKSDTTALFVVVFRSILPTTEPIQPNDFVEYFKAQMANVPNSTITPYSFQNGQPVGRVDLTYQSGPNLLVSTVVQWVHKNTAFTVMSIANSATYDKHKSDFETFLQRIDLN